MTAYIVKVTPLVKKVRDKVRQHGEFWIARYDLKSIDDPTAIAIETMVPVHHSKYPYSRWVRDGIECKLERVGKVLEPK